MASTPAARRGTLLPKIPPLQYRDDGFFALSRHDRELDLALLDIEHGIGRIPLRKENLVFLALQSRSAVAGSCEKGHGIEWRGSFALPLTSLPVVSMSRCEVRLIVKERWP